MEGKCYVLHHSEATDNQHDVVVDVTLDLLAEAALVQLLYCRVAQLSLHMLCLQHKDTDTELYLLLDNVWYFLCRRHAH